MPNETIGNWVEKAKANAATHSDSTGTVNVVRRAAAPTTGQMIMDMADKLWPGLMDLLKGAHDGSGLLLQPAHVRGIALNMAQTLVKKNETKNSNS